MSPSVQPANLEGEFGWILPAPLAEVLDALIALMSLRELKDGVIGVNLMCDVFVLPGVLLMALKLSWSHPEWPAAVLCGLWWTGTLLLSHVWDGCVRPHPPTPLGDLLIRRVAAVASWGPRPRLPRRANRLQRRDRRPAFRPGRNGRSRE